MEVTSLGVAPAGVDADGDGAVGEGAEDAGPEVGAPYPEGAHVPRQHLLPVRRRPHICAANPPQSLVVAQRAGGDGDSDGGTEIAPLIAPHHRGSLPRRHRV